jgi:hypothetical protein
LVFTHFNDFVFFSLRLCVSLGQSLHVGFKTLSHRFSQTFGHKLFWVLLALGLDASGPVVELDSHRIAQLLVPMLLLFNNRICV